MNSKSQVKLEENNLILKEEKHYYYLDKADKDKIIGVDYNLSEKKLFEKNKRGLLYTAKKYDDDGNISVEEMINNGDYMRRSFYSNGNIHIDEGTIKKNCFRKEYSEDGDLINDHISIFANHQKQLHNESSVETTIHLYEDSDEGFISFEFYDPKSRIQKEIYCKIENAELYIEHITKFTYDEHTGKIKQIEKKYERVLYEYDKSGNLISVKLFSKSDAEDIKLKKVYVSLYENNILRQRECFSEESESRWRAKYVYDENDNIKEVIYMNNDIVLYNEMYHYNEISKIKERTYIKDNTTLFKETYNYDTNGRIISQSNYKYRFADKCDFERVGNDFDF